MPAYARSLPAGTVLSLARVYRRGFAGHVSSHSRRLDIGESCFPRVLPAPCGLCSCLRCTVTYSVSKCILPQGSSLGEPSLVEQGCSKLGKYRCLIVVDKAMGEMSQFAVFLCTQQSLKHNSTWPLLAYSLTLYEDDPTSLM